MDRSERCESAGWLDRRALDCHGEPVGVVVDVYVDLDSGRPAWLAISSGFFGTRIVVAPVRGASLLGDDVVIAHDRSVISTTPAARAIVTIPPAVQRCVIDHYARSHSGPAERHHP